MYNNDRVGAALLDKLQIKAFIFVHMSRNIYMDANLAKTGHRSQQRSKQHRSKLETLFLSNYRFLLKNPALCYEIIVYCSYVIETRLL